MMIKKSPSKSQAQAAFLLEELLANRCFGLGAIYSECPRDIAKLFQCRPKSTQRHNILARHHCIPGHLVQLTWLALEEDQAALSRRVEQLIALRGL
jgi:hypothetical protein